MRPLTLQVFKPRLKFLDQEFLCPMDAGFDGAQAYAKRIGDLLMAHLFVAVEKEGNPVRRGERCQGCLDDLLAVAALKKLIRRFR